jgi:hypothetical protein
MIFECGCFCKRRELVGQRNFHHHNFHWLHHYPVLSDSILEVGVAPESSMIYLFRCLVLFGAYISAMLAEQLFGKIVLLFEFRCGVWFLYPNSVASSITQYMYEALFRPLSPCQLL